MGKLISSDFIIQENTTVFDAAAAIDASARQVVFVCDGLKLLASFSDSDLRRYILHSGDMTKPVCNAANYSPIAVSSNELAKAQRLLDENPYIKGIPILNKNGEIVSIAFTETTRMSKKKHLGIPIVIMAGGKGTRLAPFTDILPKPLIPVGDMTVTEHIMERFLGFGCTEFTMIVSHKKELIKAYFSETTLKGSLQFVDEEQFQGTGGGLKLLEGIVNSTFFMTNCDILIEADYGDILKHHRENRALITMVCAMKKVTVPYGTIELNEVGKPISLVEKPEYPLLTNTGLYVIEPSFLDTIPSGAYVHITELIQNLMDEGQPVGMYPIGEAGWLDMGQLSELKKMRRTLSCE